ncbi:MAG: hypothetical protein MJ238_06405, partial [Bacilli bacterium]|nr:hypothetical protein [Bacilli bacterium]
NGLDVIQLKKVTGSIKVGNIAAKKVSITVEGKNDISAKSVLSVAYASNTYTLSESDMAIVNASKTDTATASVYYYTYEYTLSGAASDLEIKGATDYANYITEISIY